MGLKIDEVKEELKSTREMVEETHEAARMAYNPANAVKEMKESDEYEGEVFKTWEIKDYIVGKLSEAEEDNPRSGEEEADKTARGTFNYAATGKVNSSRSATDEYLEEEMANSDQVREVIVDGDTYFMDEESYQQLQE